MTMDWIRQLQFDERGLIPAVVQDVSTRKVLMVAYMNRESIQKTVETGQTWFWSRSRKELWNKGATSGHVQYVQSIAYDCDQDTLLIEVEQVGVACHTGAYSCFYETAYDTGSEGAVAEQATSTASTKDRFAILEELLQTIDRRYEERPEGAYTTYLFEKGLDKILKKVGEEATEVVIAGKNNDPYELTCEAGDLIYHLLVLLKQQGLPFDRVLEELEQRHSLKDNRNKVK